MTDRTTGGAAEPVWGRVRVRGDSMLPTLAAGDLLWVSSRARPRAGDLVVARFADGTEVVKRAVRPQVTASGRPGWWLLSDHPEVGVDSRHRGPVAGDQVLAVVRWRVWPRPGRLRPRG